MRRGIARLLTVAALVPALGVAGWIATEEARTGYFATEPRVPVGPDVQGWATIGDTSIRLGSFEVLEGMEDWDGSLWRPPEGYRLVRAEIELESGAEDIAACDVYVEDDDGRRIAPPDPMSAAMPGNVADTIDCGGIDPSFDPTLETVFLLPEDSTPSALVITDDIVTRFAPEYISLPLR